MLISTNSERICAKKIAAQLIGYCHLSGCVASGKVGGHSFEGVRLWKRRLSHPRQAGLGALRSGGPTIEDGSVLGRFGPIYAYRLTLGADIVGAPRSSDPP